MTSRDIFTLAGSEQEFRVYVITKLDAADQRLDGIDQRLDAADKRLSNVESVLETQSTVLQDMHEQLMIQNARLASMEYWGGIGFTILAAVIAFVGVFAPRFWTPAREASASSSSPRRSFISVDDFKDLYALIRGDTHNNPAP